MRNYITLFIFLISCSISNGQNQVLENKLKPYFGNLPILQSPDSVLRYAFADTAKKGNKSPYNVFVYYDSLSPAKVVDPNWRYDDSLKTRRLEEFEVYSNYYETESVGNYDVNVSYRDQITAHNSVDCSVFAVKIYTTNVHTAKKNYRKMKRKFSPHFEKQVTEKNMNRFTGARWSATYFYLNKTDQFPLLEIRWARRSHMTSQGNRIYIYRKN